MITVHRRKGVIRPRADLSRRARRGLDVRRGRRRGAADGRAVTVPIIVGLSGLAGAGKSTAARHLVERHGFVRRPFAALLKGMLRYLLHAQGVPAGDVERMVDGDLKEVPTRHLGGADAPARHADARHGMGQGARARPVGGDVGSLDRWAGSA